MQWITSPGQEGFGSSLLLALAVGLLGTLILIVLRRRSAGASAAGEQDDSTSTGAAPRDWRRALGAAFSKEPAPAADDLVGVDGIRAEIAPSEVASKEGGLFCPPRISRRIDRIEAMMRKGEAKQIG